MGNPLAGKGLTRVAGKIPLGAGNENHNLKAHPHTGLEKRNSNTGQEFSSPTLFVLISQ